MESVTVLIKIVSNMGRYMNTQRDYRLIDCNNFHYSIEHLTEVFVLEIRNEFIYKKIYFDIHIDPKQD